MEAFTKKVIETIQSVPNGKVATYGQIAKLAGNPRAARQVSRLLHTMSEKYDLPWHRIINAQGKIVIANPERQIKKLENEGITVTSNGKINLKHYQWQADLDLDDYDMNG